MPSALKSMVVLTFFVLCIQAVPLQAQSLLEAAKQLNVENYTLKEAEKLLDAEYYALVEAANLLDVDNTGMSDDAIEVAAKQLLSDKEMSKQPDAYSSELMRVISSLSGANDFGQQQNLHELKILSQLKASYKSASKVRRAYKKKQSSNAVKLVTIPNKAVKKTAPIDISSAMVSYSVGSKSSMTNLIQTPALVLDGSEGKIISRSAFLQYSMN